MRWFSTYCLTTFKVAPPAVVTKYELVHLVDEGDVLERMIRAVGADGIDEGQVAGGVVPALEDLHLLLGAEVVDEEEAHGGSVVLGGATPVLPSVVFEDAVVDQAVDLLTSSSP